MHRLQIECIVQAGCTFKGRYECMKAITYKKPNSKFAQHILDSKHAYGPIQDTTNVL